MAHAHTQITHIHRSHTFDKYINPGTKYGTWQLQNCSDRNRKHPPTHTHTHTCTHTYTHTHTHVHTHIHTHAHTHTYTHVHTHIYTHAHTHTYTHTHMLTRSSVCDSGDHMYTVLLSDGVYTYFVLCNFYMQI